MPVKTFKEWLYNLCNQTDMSNEEDATMLVQTLARELKLYHAVAMRHEEKLKETLTAKEYEEYSAETSKELFREDLDGMADGDFKDFCIKHFDEITSPDGIIIIDSSEADDGTD